MTGDTKGRDLKNKQTKNSNRLGEGICDLQIVVYMNALLVNKQKTSNPLETWIRVIKWQLTAEEIITANKHLKTFTTAAVIRK